MRETVCKTTKPYKPYAKCHHIFFCISFFILLHFSGWFRCRIEKWLSSNGIQFVALKFKREPNGQNAFFMLWQINRIRINFTLCKIHSHLFRAVKNWQKYFFICVCRWNGEIDVDRANPRGHVLLTIAAVVVVVDMMQKRKTPKDNKIVNPFLFHHKFTRKVTKVWNSRTRLLRKNQCYAMSSIRN